MTTLPFKKLHPDGKLTRGSEWAAGYDLYAVEKGTVTDRTTKFKTGVAIEIPPGYVGFIRDRSSLGEKGIIAQLVVELASGEHITGGVMDSDYRGEVLVCLTCISGPSPYHPVNVGDKIAQLVVVPCFQGEPTEVEALSETTRGTKGFGELTGR